MPDYTNNKTRRFSYTEPILYMWESYPSAKTDLRDMAKVFTRDNLKKYLNKFLGVSAPTSISATLMYNQNKQNYDN